MKLFYVDSLGSTRRFPRWHKNMHFHPPRRCPVNLGHRRSTVRDEFLRVTINGSNDDDLWWTLLSECMVTTRVVTALLAEGLTGFGIKSVDVEFEDDVTGARARKYHESLDERRWEFITTGYGGIARPESGVRRVEFCGGCGYSKYTHVSKPERLFDPAQWDGSDFFRIWPMPLYTFVSPRAAEVLRNSGWTGFRLAPIDDLQGDSDDTLTPGWPYWYWPTFKADIVREKEGLPSELG